MEGIAQQSRFEAKNKDSIFDANSGMTTYTSKGQSYSRYFHNEESIQYYLTTSGFHIKDVSTYHEQLCIDFQRTQLSEQVDALIEVLAAK